MKHRISITMDEETFFKIREAQKAHRFRNRSHAIEYAINEVFR